MSDLTKRDLEILAIYDDAKTAARLAVKVLDVFDESHFGDCGFAWVKISGRSKLSKLLRLINEGSKGVLGGYLISPVQLFNTQSLEIKNKACVAFAEVLNANGIKAVIYSRYD